MEYSTQEVSPTVTEFAVTVDADEVQAKINVHYGELKSQVQLPGFRKGKVPRSILKKRFGREIELEVAQELLGGIVQKVLSEGKFRPIGQPTVKKLEVEEGKPLEFGLVVEHIPHFEIQNYKGLAPAAEAIDVEESAIEKELRQLLLARAEGEEVDREVQVGDRIKGRFRLTVDGTVEGDSEELSNRLQLVVGEDELFPSTELDQKIVGHKPNAEFQLEATMPEDYPVERLQGKAVVLDMLIETLEELEVPELTDEFAQENFQASVEELRQQIQEKIEKERKQEQRSKRLDAALDKLREANPFELPKTLLISEIQREEEEWERRDVPTAERERLREKLNERAEKRVRNGILLQMLIEAESIEVQPEDIENRFAELSPLLGGDTNAIRSLYQSQPQMRERLENEILEGKAIQVLLDSQPSLIVEV